MKLYEQITVVDVVVIIIMVKINSRSVGHQSCYYVIINLQKRRKKVCNKSIFIEMLESQLEG